MQQTSFWEDEVFLKNIDITIIGSGIVGLTCALKLRELNPKSKIVILERGFLPSGASTKNAGFTCFGSPTELLDDLNNMTIEEVYNLVKMRVNGLKKLRKLIGDPNMNYQEYGSYELFNDKYIYESAVESLPMLNNLLYPIFNAHVFKKHNHHSQFGFNKNTLMIKNKFEGQINTGLMMQKLINLCKKSNIEILNGFNVDSYEQINDKWIVSNSQSHIQTNKLLICNNAFANKLLHDIDLKPARAQVLITNPINNLKIKGCFHLDRGYYYFRNVGNRVLIGGGRNLDFNTEETHNIATTELIQQKLESILKNTILPNHDFTIDKKWAGIMGIGTSKTPIVKQLNNNLFCGIRMGGMGVALGTEIGEKLALTSLND